MKPVTLLQLFALGRSAIACNHHLDDREWTAEELDHLEAKWGSNVCIIPRRRQRTSPNYRSGLGGIGSFAHLDYVKCLTEPKKLFDIAIVGAPFDTAVTYRPGARFGPRAIRHASGRQHSLRGYNPRANINPYQNWAKIVDSQNWKRFSADDIDTLGTQGVINGIMDILGTDSPVYLSVDIDVLDPAFALGTGTPKPGGWSTGELIKILRGIEGLNLVGADVVEVSPVYQGAGEETTFAAAQVVYELLTSMVKWGRENMGKEEINIKDEL
ncbi:arginase family-domain-containing protein [Aspergillus pseudoustus]|uniref:Arginase family-domain-containing protein n=1 Tax=Aspergillus pseudoustus TaxID=1810923 RepID=A0ABR4KAT6_9EURO